ncbi:MAG: hypothetical protein GY868_01980, partial [Deltaproteobacteria bacterium]|nr:hypothetical protein [Deltaproteobacteria bacterium]
MQISKNTLLYIFFIFTTSILYTGCRPVVTITSPDDSMQFEQNAEILFVCSAFDLQDLQLTDNSITWQSSRDGEIGNGAQCSVNTLSPGAHDITVKATDSGAWNTYDTITVKINASAPAPAPVASTTSSSSSSSSTTTTAEAATDPAPSTSTTTAHATTTTLPIETASTTTTSLPATATTTTSLAWTTVGDADDAGLNAVWGTPDGSDYFAVGNQGMILHYNSNLDTWERMTKPDGLNITGVKLNAIWGTSAQSVAAVGASSILIYYDGNTWTVHNGGGFTVGDNKIGELRAIWGTSDSNVFAVGENGIIMNCSDISDPLGSTDMPWWGGTDLYGIWGSSTEEIFAVGENANLLEYLGETRNPPWEPYDFYNDDVTTHLNHVFGFPDSDQAFAVGTGGTILKSDGGVWKPMASGSTSDLFSVWGSSATDLFAVGAGGTILHGDGSVWVPMGSGTTADLR